MLNFMKNNLYNTKVKLIGDIFDIIMNDGYMETKEDAISIYTKDKLKNKVFVKKLDINKKFNDSNNDIFIDSVAITNDNYYFDNCCDADIRVAINDRKIGKRIVCWINELDYWVLQNIHDYILTKYEPDLDIKHYNKLIEIRNNESINGMNVNIPRQSLDWILMRFKEEIIDKK